MVKKATKLFLVVALIGNFGFVFPSTPVEFDTDDNGSGSGASSGSGSGQPPTSAICDDEDNECEPSVREITETTTKLDINSPTIRPMTMTSAAPLFTIGQPRFHGDSFMVFPGLALSAGTSFEVSVWFKAERRDGLLLLAGRRSTKKDFLAVGLVRGYVELRFSNGADTVTLTTPNNVTLGRWHQVVVFRDQHDGYVTLDYVQLVSGSSKKNRKLMNFDTPLYVGGLPRYRVDYVPYAHGFFGCIKEVMVNSRKLDVRLPGGEAKRSSNIGECRESRQSCQCKNGGICQFTDTGEPICACPLGATGQFCQHEISLKLPSFNGNSFLTYPSTGSVASKSFTISLTLKSSSETGLLLLNTDRAKGQGDFFSLSLREGMVEFMFDCGSGAAIIRSKEPISTEYWHTITIWRSGNKGSLKIDDGLPVFGESLGRLRHISLRQDLYIGGMKDYKYQPFEVDMRTGFAGCIQKVTINYIPLDLSSPTSGVNIGNCDHVCVTQSVCQNSGTCHALRDGFQCQCPIGFTGKLCEKSLNIKMPSFPGRSFLTYPSLGHEAYKAFTISIVLKPRQDTGLVMYNGQHINGRGDFVSISLRKGFVEFAYDCGSGAAVLRSKTKILIEQWHTITVSRNGRKGKLILDDGIPVLGESPGIFRHVTLKDDLYIGGVKDFAQLPLASNVRTGFIGCVQKVTINSRTLDLSQPLSGVNVHNCDHVCVTHYVCMNSGICHASMDSFKCQCSEGYSGMLCDTAVKVNSYDFDGNSIATITKKKILRRISGSAIDIRLQIKTAESNAVILYVHKEKFLHRAYLTILLNNGVLEIRYKIENKKEIMIIKSKQLVNDDKWHKLQIKRASSIWSIIVDDIKTDKDTKDKVPLELERGEMLIGGTTDHTTTDLPNFKGSLKGLVIGGYKIDVTEEFIVNVDARKYRIADREKAIQKS